MLQLSQPVPTLPAASHLPAASAVCMPFCNLGARKSANGDETSYRGTQAVRPTICPQGHSLQGQSHPLQVGSLVAIALTGPHKNALLPAQRQSRLHSPLSATVWPPISVFFLIRNASTLREINLETFALLASYLFCPCPSSLRSYCLLLLSCSSRAFPYTLRSILPSLVDLFFNLFFFFSFLRLCLQFAILLSQTLLNAPLTETKHTSSSLPTSAYF